jgi:hypothetical protein
MSPSTHRTAPVPHLRASSQTQDVQHGHQRHQTNDAPGQQTAVGRIGDIGRHDCRVRPDPSVFSTLLSAAFLNRASFSSSIASDPHRLVIFFNVEWFGTDPPRGMRQNRDQLTESVTSRHNVSKPSRYRYFKNTSLRYDSIGIEGLPSSGSKNLRNGSKSAGSSSNSSTRASSAGIRNASSSSTDSHRLGPGP